MPLQNRVTPEGDIVATAARGLVMGNRGGAFHDPSKRLGRRRWANRQWICCRLEFKGRRREVMAPGRYTELFFLDEATALAAGHRPCFECRRQDALEFARLWASLAGSQQRPSAPEMDRVLHAERLEPDGSKRTWQSRASDLPAGTFVRHRHRPHLVWENALLPWSLDGYGAAASLEADDTLAVLTPRTIVGILAAGFRPLIHPSAQSRRDAATRRQ